MEGFERYLAVLEGELETASGTIFKLKQRNEDLIRLVRKLRLEIAELKGE